MLIFKTAIKAIQTPTQLVSPIMQTFAKKKGKKGGEDKDETLVKGDDRLIRDVESTFINKNSR